MASWILSLLGLLFVLAGPANADAGRIFGDIPPPPMIELQHRVKFGAVLPLSGPGAAIGESDRIGIELAVERMNDDGGVDGTPLEAVIEDSRTEAQAGLSAFKKLAEVDHIPAVIATATSVAMAIRPESERRAIVMFAESAHPGLTKDTSYVFRSFYRTDTANIKLVDYASSRKLQRIALLHAEEEWGEGARADLEKRLVLQNVPEGGKRLVLVRTESFAKSAADLKPQLLRIAAEKPDIVYVVGIGPAVALAYRQLRQLSLRTQVAGFMVCGQPDVISGARKEMEGTIGIEAQFDTAGNEYKYLKDRFEQRYAGRQLDQSVVMAFDAATIISKALRAGNVGGTEVREFILSRKKFLGAAGVIEFEESGDAKREMQLKTIKNGQCVPMAGSAPVDLN